TREPRLLRPLNYPPAAGAPGKGAELYTLPDGRRVGVVQLQGNVFMRQALACPFEAADRALDQMPLGTVADAIIVDMHCEATSEKMAMGH
ncbi:MAG TPA: metallophosphoesterase, partial [Hyphomonas sp.]|nr:metallophosphoesterase [Hyphomonas sp.]